MYLKYDDGIRICLLYRFKILGRKSIIQSDDTKFKPTDFEKFDR